MTGIRWLGPDEPHDETLAWELRPFEGAGPLHFGMTRDDVIATFGEPDGMLDDDPLLVEEYDDLRVQPGYDAVGHLIAVQLVERHPFTIRGISPAGQELDDIRRELEDGGIACIPKYDGIDLPELGIHLYAPKYNPGDPRPIEAVLIGSRVYEEAYGQG